MSESESNVTPPAEQPPPTPQSDPSIAPPPRVGVVLFIALLALAALSISTFLLYIAWKGGAVPGCGPDSGWSCDEVLASRWSHWFKLPVSLPAIVVYILVLFQLVNLADRQNADNRRHAWDVLMILAVVLLGAAVWFTAIQALVIKGYCWMCLAAHGLGAVIAVTILAARPRGTETWSPIGWAAVALALLVGAQVVYKPPRMIALANNHLRNIQPGNFPLVGSPDAKHVFVYLFDYTCPHCQEQHHNLKLAMQRYGRDQLAIIKLPVPLDSRCNRTVEETSNRHKTACDLAKLALAVYLADPSKFAEYDSFLFATGETRPVAEARVEAESLIGKEALDKALADPWIQKQINTDIDLYELSSKWANHRAIPQIITAPLIIAGQPGSPEELFELLEKQVGLKAPAGKELPPASQPAATMPALPVPPPPPPPPASSSITIPPNDHATGSQNPADGGAGNTR